MWRATTPVRQALANFAKGVAKLCVVGGVMAVMLWPQRQMLGSIVTGDPAMLLPFIRSIVLKLLGTVVAVLAVIAAADYFFQYRQWYERQKDVAAGDQGRIPPDRGRSHDQRQASPIARHAHAQAHHRGGAEGLRGHHQPDPLCGRSQIRAWYERAGLRRQGRGPDRPQDPRDRRRASHSRGREPAACARLACDRGDRPGNSAGALSRGRRNHRLHYASAPYGEAARRCNRACESRKFACARAA